MSPRVLMLDQLCKNLGHFGANTEGGYRRGNILEARASDWSLGCMRNVSVCPARMTALVSHCVSTLSQSVPLGPSSVVEIG